MGEAVYLDTTVFTSATLVTGKIGEAAKELLTQIIKGKLKAYTSVLTFDELFWTIRKRLDHDTAVDYTESFINIPNLIFVDADLDVIAGAHALLSDVKLRPRDAIHAASAMRKGVKIIISEDKDFDKIEKLKRVSLEQF